MSYKLCKCGSGANAEDCCLPLINGEIVADTPEKLMRSRYVAYSMANIPYIVATMRDNALVDYDDNEAFEWASRVKWLKLEVLASTENTVTFKAYYLDENLKAQVHYEHSTFKFENNKWFYVDGEY